MYTQSRIARQVPFVVTLLATALVVAACGSSSKTSSGASGSTQTSASTSGSTSRTKLQACLKSKGVTLPNFQRRPGGASGPSGPSGATGTPPTGAPPAGASGPSGTTGSPGLFNGGGPTGTSGATGPGGPAGRFKTNPKLQAALKACGANFGTRRAGFNGGAGAAAFKKYQTQYQTAVKTYAACVTSHGYTMPAPNFARGASVFPASVEKNKKFQAAAKSCTLKLPARPSFRGGAPGAPGGAPPTGTTGTTSGT